MNRVRRLAATIGFCAVLALSDLAPVAAQAAVPEYTARVVARLDYGTDLSQILINWGNLSDRVTGPLASWEFTEHAPACGPCAIVKFQVDAAGNLYLATYSPPPPPTDEDPQGYTTWMIKKFAPLGLRALASLAMYIPTHDVGFDVSPEGMIFFFESDRSETEPLGWLSAYAPDGRRLWARPVREIVDFFLQSDFSEECRIQGPGVSLRAIRGPYVICTPHASRPGPTGPVQVSWAVLLDADGNLVTVLPTRDVAPDGRLYRTAPTAWGEPYRPRLQFLDADWAVCQEILPDATLQGEELFGDCQIVWDLFLDARGQIVVSCLAKDIPDRFPYGSILEAYTQVNFVRYDPQGRFLDKWSFPGSPLEDLTYSTIIGHDGNIYHLAFDDTGVDVIQYAPAPGYAVRPGGGPQVTHLVAFRQGDTLYTRLRDVASRSGAKVAWLAKDSAALVTKADCSLRLRPGSDVALDGSGEAVSLGAPVELRQGRLWVPATRVAALLDLPLYTDKAERVAYLITHPAR